MRRNDKPVRPGGLALTATTLVALVSVVAALPAAPTRVTGTGSVRTLGEATTMRAVAAAIAVVACDHLLGTPIPSPAPPPAGAAKPARPGATMAVLPSPAEILGERRLDLPPPRV